jgi:hypothetical protein
VLLAPDLDEHFVQKKGVAVTLAFSLETASELGPEFVHPESDCLIADRNISFCE